VEAPTIDLSMATSVTCRRIGTSSVAYRSDDPAVLRLLAHRLRLKPPTGAVCLCPGTLELFFEGGLPSLVTLHHGTSVRWPGSPGNVELLDPDRMMDFLADHGMPFVRDDHRAALERSAHDLAEAERWQTITPHSLQRFSRAMAAPHTPDELIEWAAALAAEFPDPVLRARILLAWYGRGSGPWSGYPLHESVAFELLNQVPDAALVEAIATTTDDDASFGALRLLNGYARKRLEAVLRKIPGSTLSRLEIAAAPLLQPEHRIALELMHGSLAKRAAARIPVSQRSQPAATHVGSLVLPVRFIPRPGAQLESLDVAMRELHDRLLAFIHPYAYATDVWREYLSERARVEGVRRLDAAFEFPDVGRPRSQWLAHRWFRIALSASSTIEPALSQLGYHLDAVPALRDVLDEPRHPMLLARDRLWLVGGTPSAPELVGDGQCLEPDERERAESVDLLVRNATHDPVEHMVLPAPQSDATFAQHLRRAGRHVPAVLWFASHCARPSLDLIDAVISAIGHADLEQCLRAAERLGSRICAPDTVIGYVGHEDARFRAAALMMLAGQARQRLISHSATIDMMLRGIDRSAVERRVVAEQLGYVRTDEDRPRVTAAIFELLERPDVDDDCAEYAFVSLANLYSATRVPEPVLASVAAVTVRQTRAGALARWFLERFTPRHP
jgi:hypothetical protein